MKQSQAIVDERLYSVVDRLTGYERRHLTALQAKASCEAHREACARFGWRSDTRVFYRDGTDVTQEVLNG